MRDFHEYLRSVWGQAMMLTFAATFAGPLIVAIWAAKSRVHWFLRALAVWGGVMLLVPVRVYELAATLAVASPLVMMAVSAIDWFEACSQTKQNSSPPIRLTWWQRAVGAVLAIFAASLIFQGHWWFEPLDVLAWCIVLFGIAATMLDCGLWGGRATWQRLISLRSLLTKALQLASVSLTPIQSGGTAVDHSPDNRWFRFRIHDLLLLMPLVAVIIVGLQRINQQYTIWEWLAFAVWGALLAGIAGLAYGCAISRWRLIYAPLGVLLIMLTARVAPRICGAFFARWFMECLGFGRVNGIWSETQKLLALEIVYFEMAAFIMTASLLLISRSTAVLTSPRKNLVRIATAASLMMCALPLGWLYWQMLWLTPIPPAFSSGPTNYDRIAEIVSHVDPATWWGTPFPPVATAKRPPPKVAGDKQQLIAELLMLVQSDSYVPFTFANRVLKENEIRNVWWHGNHFGCFAQLLDAEAATLGDQGQWDEAAELAIANIRLGTMLRRGGTRGHDQIGQYCERYGYQRLTLIRDHLSAGSLARGLATLLRAQDESEPYESMWARDRAFEERALGWTQRLRNVFHDMRYGNRWNPHQEIQAFNALLQTDIAIRLFQHEFGRLPERLDELVPKFLPAVPLDPYAEPAAPLHYRLDDHHFVLYSVGVFGEDNGGTFGNGIDGLHRGDHDIDVETWTRP